MLLSPVFIGMGAVVSGLLNSYGRFGVPAVAPLVYNLAIIVAAVVLAPILGVEGLAIGVVAGSILHLAIQLPQLRKVAGHYDLTIGLGHPGVRKVAWLMGPRLFGLAAGQVNFVASTILASNLGVGAVTAYNYAFQLSQIPVGVLGVSVAVALFPTFSRDAALGRIAEIRRQLSTSLRILIFLAAPLTAIMIVLARPIAAVFFQYGLFTDAAAERTAGALVFFSIGLTGHIVVHVLTRAFYAMQDTRIPVLWAVIAVAINVPLMAILSGPMEVEGLALALSISASLEVIGLALALRRRIDSIDEGRILQSGLRSVLAAGVAALVMLGGLTAAQEWFVSLLANGLGRVLVLLVLAAAGTAAYVLVAILLRSDELGQVRRYLLHRAPREAA
jgi:putative peptidoglycan lipid II flippase